MKILSTVERKPPILAYAEEIEGKLRPTEFSAVQLFLHGYCCIFSLARMHNYYLLFIAVFRCYESTVLIFTQSRITSKTTHQDIQ